MATLVIVTTDLHAHKYKQFNQGNRRLENIIKYIDYLFKYAAKNGINLIKFCGDLYNTMQNIATEVEDTIIRCFADNFRNYPEVQWIAISGNHDHATKNLEDSPAVSALHHLDLLFEGFNLIDNDGYSIPQSNTFIQGIPYYEYPDHFRAQLNKAANKAELLKNAKNILLIHQQIGMEHAMVPDHISPDDDLFKPFDIVLNGHIHQFSRVRKHFINVGSPMHRDAGDVGIDKGFVVMDLEDLSWDFIETTNKYPQYIHKNVGEELTEWEKTQYVIWVPQAHAKTADEAELVENFNTSLKPIELITNFVSENMKIGTELLSALDITEKKLISFGLKYL